MSRIEKGRQTPSLSKLKALLSRLGLPSEKYYATLSEDEMTIETLKSEIVDFNTRLLYKEALAKIEKLAALTKENDKLTQQFILRSRALAGKEKNSEIEPYTAKEQLELLWKAIRLTKPKFDLEDIDRLYYSLDEIKVINQMGLLHIQAKQYRKANEIYYLPKRYLDKRFHINESTSGIAILIIYNYALSLCESKRYDEAEEIAEYGRKLSIKWSRSGSLGGLLYVLGECKYRNGRPEECKKYFIRSYYAFLNFDDFQNAEVTRDNLKEYFSMDI